MKTFIKEIYFISVCASYLSLYNIVIQYSSIFCYTYKIHVILLSTLIVFHSFAVTGRFFPLLDLLDQLHICVCVY